MKESTAWRTADVLHRAKGDFFCLQGEPVTCIYLLTKGLVKRTGTTQSGKEVVLDWMLPGDAFGLGALIPEMSAHRWNVVAVEQSEAVSWNRTAIGRIARRSPEVLQSALRIALAWAAELQTRFEQLSDGLVEQRLAHFILHLRDSFDGTGRNLPITQEEFAAMTGTNVFTVNKVLNRWQQMGYISKERRRTTVLDRQSLVRISRGTRS